MKLVSLKCSVCGGSIIQGKEGQVCEFCGTPVSEMSLEDTAKIESMNRANEARRNFDFDEAIRAYTQILSGDTHNAEAHWNLALSKFGIEYESERIGGRINFKPTIHRLRYESFDKDADYRGAMRDADDSALDYYMTEGKRLAKIQSRLLELVSTEQEYDVFISFKAEDSNGNRSRDSLIAQEIYERLTSSGIRTFFSRISLQDVGGDEYEPHIFAALNSARVMVLVGTDLSYINYGWVKNEWTRYLDLMKESSGSGRSFITVYENLPKEMFPKRIPMQDAVDWTKKDAALELVHGVSMLLGKGGANESRREAEKLVADAQKALDRGNTAAAVKKAQEAVAISPDLGDAWFLLFLCENGCRNAEQLSSKTINWMDSHYYARAYETSRGIRRQVLDAVKNKYQQKVKDEQRQAQAAETARLAEDTSLDHMQKALAYMRNGSFSKARDLLYDNVVLSDKVEHMREVCELGTEYEKINPSEYLRDKLQKENPAAYKKVIKGASSANFSPMGSAQAKARVRWGILLLILVLVRIIILPMYEVNYRDSFLMAVHDIDMALILIPSSMLVLRCIQDLTNIHSLPVSIVVVVVTVMVVWRCVEKMPLLFVLAAAALALTVVSWRDANMLLHGDSNHEYYLKQVAPLEEKWIAEYKEKYADLTEYTTLKELTSVWRG